MPLRAVSTLHFSSLAWANQMLSAIMFSTTTTCCCCSDFQTQDSCLTHAELACILRLDEAINNQEQLTAFEAGNFFVLFQDLLFYENNSAFCSIEAHPIITLNGWIIASSVPQLCAIRNPLSNVHPYVDATRYYHAARLQLEMWLALETGKQQRSKMPPEHGTFEVCQIMHVQIY